MTLLRHHSLTAEQRPSQFVPAAQAINPGDAVLVLFIRFQEQIEGFKQIFLMSTLSNSTYTDGTRINWIVASKTIPVRPMPPTVAQRHRCSDEPNIP